ncbi:MAG: peptidyl-prolyl cis-trans isomerase [Stenotrophobium sp.]
MIRRYIALCCLCAVTACFAMSAQAAQAPSPATVKLSDGDILFLEALQRGYALDDIIVRRELERRMRDAILQAHPLPDPDDKTLAKFQSAHASQYRAAARYSFDQVYLNRTRHGAQLPSVTDQIAQRLHDAPEKFSGLGDPFPRGQHFQDLNPAEIVAIFGFAIVQKVPGLPIDTWQGPLSSPLGLHFIRVTAVQPSRELTLAEARPRLLVDYREAEKARIMRAALAQLRKKYAKAKSLPKPVPTDEDIP